MASVGLLPGYGSRYTSETISGVASPGTVSADVLDTSRCSQFAVQITTAGTPGSSTLQVEQTMDGTNWATLGTAATIVLGAILRFGAFGGPYGVVRFRVTDAAGAVTTKLTVVGFPMQRMN